MANYFLVVLLVCFQSPSSTQDVGLFAKSLWFLHEFGSSDCSSVESDSRVKSVLAKSLAKDRFLTSEELDGLIEKSTFEKFAGSDNILSESEIVTALEASVPPSRQALFPDIRRHAELLTTSYDLIPHDHQHAVNQLADWIVENWEANKPLHIITTCTGNSRRSILGASMGNVAAAYYGFANVRFYSGGTTPSAFNKRTIATLKEIGFAIEPTGEEAERGDPKVANSIFEVKWGQDAGAIEFSKSYRDKSNPQSGFAAILVCSEADVECPVIPGASLRVSMTFLDPKLYDDGAFEKQKYAERRDDIGRSFLAIMANARRKLSDKAHSK